jgi:hypothetical protein
MSRIIFATLLMTACAPAGYVEPTGDDTALLIIENQGPIVFGYELEAATFRDAVACSGRLRIGEHIASSRGSTQRARISAGGNFTVQLRGTGGGASGGEACAVATTFRPLAGERYTALFRLEERRCELLIVRQRPLAAGGGRFPERQLARREPGCL